MVKLRLIVCSILLVPSVCLAADFLPLDSVTSPATSLFFSSEQNGSQVDSWTLNSGYRYSIDPNWHIFVGTRLDSHPTQISNGVMSGISYQYNDKLLLSSTLHSVVNTYSSGVAAHDDNSDDLSAELSSQYRFNDQLDMHATLGYQGWQQDVQVGIGFRF
ncbi:MULTISPECIES: ribonuclease regulator [Vibrio]|uniref:Ribonuclease regulator n=2 Tax=Vibrio TaxID=662 RepID=A0A7X4RT71_9VIBR|nr:MULTISPECIES: ribonuclease regulator [Vibrio]MBF9001562.1 ribonuclease regulator [Vibrio nitrifigilis]MZI91764.1 ribonuclease regulator [Vibrio eleionomae]